MNKQKYGKRSEIALISGPDLFKRQLSSRKSREALRPEIPLSIKNFQSRTLKLSISAATLREHSRNGPVVRK